MINLLVAAAVVTSGTGNPRPPLGRFLSALARRVRAAGFSERVKAVTPVGIPVFGLIVNFRFGFFSWTEAMAALLSIDCARAADPTSDPLSASTTARARF